MDKIRRFLMLFCFVPTMTFVIQTTVYCQGTPTICDERIALTVNGGSSRNIPYCRNYGIEDRNESIERAVIVIHGVDRNAGDYYNYILTAADAVGASNETIIIAPQFLLKSDVGASMADLIVWADEGEGWSRGDNSCRNDGVCNDSGVGTISSFGVIDTILAKLSSRGQFPNLTQIIIAGHSAGGQFVNRFAAGSQAEGKVVRKPVKIRYIVSNPSSYLYFNKQRWDNKTDKPLFQFKVPDPSAVTDCPSYDDYRYGLENLNSYMTAAGVRKIPGRYRQRKVVYLLGGSDTDGPNLDTSCAANFQGSFRLMRGYVHYNYLFHYFGSNSLPNQSLITVPGVAHDASEMFNSECGRTCLFDASVSSTPVCGHICGR